MPINKQRCTNDLNFKSLSRCGINIFHWVGKVPLECRTDSKQILHRQKFIADYSNTEVNSVNIWRCSMRSWVCFTLVNCWQLNHNTGRGWMGVHARGCCWAIHNHIKWTSMGTWQTYLLLIPVHNHHQLSLLVVWGALQTVTSHLRWKQAWDGCFCVHCCRFMSDASRSFLCLKTTTECTLGVSHGHR